MARVPNGFKDARAKYRVRVRTLREDKMREECRESERHDGTWEG